MKRYGVRRTKKNNGLGELFVTAVISLLFWGVKEKIKNLSKRQKSEDISSSSDFMIYAIISCVLIIGVLVACYLGNKEYIYALFIIFIAVIYMYIRDENKRKKLTVELLKERENIIDGIVHRHMETLKLKYLQLVYYDDYGIIKDKEFIKELNYFIDNVISPEINVTDEERKKIIANIQVRCAPLNIVDNCTKASGNKENPYNFEKKCAQILNESGWEARATPKSLDQGVDVIAAKNGKVVVIQCKLYSKPVGNKAVQEIVAGKNYYRADYAAVVSNNTYTASARKLAKNCEVFLLFYDDLKNLDEKLNIQSIH